MIVRGAFNPPPFPFRFPGARETTEKMNLMKKNILHTLLVGVSVVFMLACPSPEPSEALGIVSGREQWAERQNRLSAYPVQERNGQEIFRYTERGTGWWETIPWAFSTSIPPGKSDWRGDPRLLRTARNTIGEMHRWEDYNGTSSFSRQG